MSEIVIFEDDLQAVEVRLEGETVWLTQKQMADLFGTTPENILMHLKNVYQEDELAESATAKDFLVVRQEGKRQVRRQLKHYNLDAVISVGYRVSSRRATRFGQWATRVLREHLTQGYRLNEHRLAQRGLITRVRRLITEVRGLNTRVRGLITGVRRLVPEPGFKAIVSTEDAP